jgi:hypothetical protein
MSTGGDSPLQNPDVEVEFPWADNVSRRCPLSRYGRRNDVGEPTDGAGCTESRPQDYRAGARDDRIAWRSPSNFP